MVGSVSLLVDSLIMVAGERKENLRIAQNRRKGNVDIEIGGEGNMDGRCTISFVLLHCHFVF